MQTDWLRWGVETVLKTFRDSEAAGYHTRDRQYAIEILAKAEEQAGAPGALQSRDDTLRGLAAFFSESTHTVWSNDEIADCLTGMITQAPADEPIKVTPSCGCIFCDLDLEAVDGIHDGPAGERIECSA